MKARSLIVAAVAAAALSLAGTASADVYSAKPGDVYRHKPASSTWNGLRVTSNTWSGLHVTGTKWASSSWS